MDPGKTNSGVATNFTSLAMIVLKNPQFVDALNARPIDTTNPTY
jgi:hypothetical protein